MLYEIFAVLNIIFALVFIALDEIDRATLHVGLCILMVLLVEFSK